MFSVIFVGPNVRRDRFMNLRRFFVGVLALLALSAVIACGDSEFREVEVVKVVEKEVPVEVIKEVEVEKIVETPNTNI